MRAHDNTIWSFRPPVETTRVGVTVTFLRQEHEPKPAPVVFPSNTSLVRLPQPTVAFYRFLYDTVGAQHVWWLRRTMPQDELASLLNAPGVSLYVLYQHHEPAGFYELDARSGHTVNLSYFGLLPHTIGRGLGTLLLRHAMTTAWAHKPRALTVNTCTADHPRALPNYLRAGFSPVRSTREVWDVPNALRLDIPEALKL